MHRRGDRGWTILVVIVGFVVTYACHFVWWLYSQPVVSLASSSSRSLSSSILSSSSSSSIMSSLSSSSSLMASTVPMDHRHNYNNLPSGGVLALTMNDAMQEAAIDPPPHLDNDDHQDHHNNARVDDYHTILHIGPFKTGSSSIQMLLRHYTIIEPLLERDDGYLVPHPPPDVADRQPKSTTKKRFNMIGLSKCFVAGRYPDDDPTAMYPRDCDVDLLQQVLSRRRHDNRRNVILSTEYFSNPYLNVTKLLQTLQPQHEVDGHHHFIVVAYYRHYYDWLISYWNQMQKLRPYRDRISIVDYIEQQQQRRLDTSPDNDTPPSITSHVRDLYERGPYFSGVIQRWQQQAAAMARSVKVIWKWYNIHDLPPTSAVGASRTMSITESFYCVALPSASRTCRAIQQQEQQHGPIRENPSKHLHYENLLYEAIEVYQLTTKENALLDHNKLFLRYDYHYHLRLLEHMEYFHIHTLGATSPYDFPKSYQRCLHPRTLQWLYERTIDALALYFPSSSSQLLEDQFWNRDATTKLCTIRYRDIVTQEASWRNFLQQLKW